MEGAWQIGVQEAPGIWASQSHPPPLAEHSCVCVSWEAVRVLILKMDKLTHIYRQTHTQRVQLTP